MLKYPDVFVFKSGSLTHLGGNCAPVLHLPLQSKPFPPPSQKSFEQRKEMTFDRRLANIAAPVVRGIYCPSQNVVKKALNEITVNSQG